VSFTSITLFVASQRMFIIVAAVYFVIDSVRKILDTPSYESLKTQPRANDSFFFFFLPRFISNGFKLRTS
jgi:hypothetical protein